MELASLTLALGQLRFTAALRWGQEPDDDDDTDEPEPPMFHSVQAIDMPEVIELDDADDDEDRLGFRLT